MPIRTALLSVFFWASMSPIAAAQTAESFPYGKDWKGKRYHQFSEQWQSAGIVIAHRPSPNTENLGPQNQVVYGLEARHHFNPRLAVMTGVHFGGNTTELEWNGNSSSVGEATPMTNTGDDSGWMRADIEQIYREVYWQVGLDIGLLETKYFHIQAGPRIGLQSASVQLESDNSAILDNIDTTSVNATGIFTGGVLRLGAFIIPFVEVGVHLQMDYTIGKELAGTGRQIGGYTVSHF